MSDLRVLHINKYGWPKGGSDVYMLRVLERLADLGVTPALWAERPPLDGRVRAYAAELPDFHAMRGASNKVKAASRVVWSKQAAAALGDVLDDFQPDVAHLHLYSHQFSSSVVDLLHKRGVATVATAHDFKLVCPSYHAVRRDQDCFRCASRLSPVAVRDRCLHGDPAWSAVALVEAAVVRRRRVVPQTVIAPSQFMFDRLSDSWISGLTDLRLLRNPANPSGTRWRGAGDYLLFVGRLSPEKGVAKLVDAVTQAGVRLVVAGDGPERGQLESQAVKLGGLVEFVGHVDDKRLAELRLDCRAQVIPSSWPENAPLAALEAGVDGVPLLMAARGGLPELLALGARGSLVSKNGGAVAWTEAIQALDNGARDDDEALVRFRAAVDWKAHLGELTALYDERAAFARAGAPTSAVEGAVNSTQFVREESSWI